MVRVDDSSYRQIHSPSRFDLTVISRLLLFCIHQVNSHDDFITMTALYTHTLCSKKSDAKIQITITAAYLTRIKYPLSGFNYHLSDVNIANFNKIHRAVSKQQLFKNGT